MTINKSIKNKNLSLGDIKKQVKYNNGINGIPPHTQLNIFSLCVIRGTINTIIKVWKLF